MFGKTFENATEQTYATGFSYLADGKIEKLRLGNGLWEAAKFNTRLQTTEITLGHGVTSGDLWKLGYEYGEIDASGNVNTAKNTGNIARQTLSFNGLANPLVQSYKYDSLYRLTEAKETSGISQNWIQTFGYDRYGNRTSTNQSVNGATINTDQNGAVTARHDYHPFGEEIASGTGGRTTAQGYGGQDSVRQKFTSYERDYETDLDFAQARFYRSSIGRFTSVDHYNIIFEMKKGRNTEEEIWIMQDYISNPQVWNKYVYASNNPLSYVDPQGEKAEVSVTVDEKNKTGTIVIKASFAFYAESGTSAQQAQNAAAQIEKNIEKAWSGTFVKDGITYTVKTDVSYVMANDQADGLSKDVMNVIGLNNGQVSASADSVTTPGGPHKADFGVWNINSISNGSAQHEFGHLLNVDDRASGTMLMNTNVLQSNQVSRIATNDDYNWALGGSVNQHINGIQDRTVTVNGRFKVPWKGNPNATSTYILRLSQSSWNLKPAK